MHKASLKLLKSPLPIRVMPGRPGSGKTKWAVLTASILKAHLVVLSENRGHVMLLSEKIGVHKIDGKLHSYEIFMSLPYTERMEVVLDDYFEANRRGLVGTIEEMEEELGVKVVGVTYSIKKC
jgi:hypothetical protein